MTLGKFKTKDELEIAYKKLRNFKFTFETIIDNIYVEKIGTDEESIIESKYLLK